MNVVDGSCMVVLHSVELFAFYVWRNIASYCIAVDLHSVNTHCDIVVVTQFTIDTSLHEQGRACIPV